MRTPNLLSGLLFIIITVTINQSCSVKEPESTGIVFDLSGNWQFRADTSKIGIQERWYYQCFTDSVRLPGTLDENKKGWLNTDTTHLHLNRVYKYYGAAWFKKEIDIPEDWQDKHIELIMERTKVTHVWLDTIYIGSNNTIFSQQVYDLTGKLTPGLHILSIVVDNDIDLVPVAGSHAYEENMQTNWNGIIGKFCLEISNQARIESVRLYPEIHTKQVKVQVKTLNNGNELKNTSIVLRAELWNSIKKHKVKEKSFAFDLSGDEQTSEMIYELGNKARLWSEFDPSLYKLYITLIADGKVLDTYSVDFGLREFKTEGTQFSINGKKILLRGKHDGCIFPLTGYPPMDTEGWIRVLNIAKEYGINHYRFHSWCPPEAAFKAADISGIYMQPELPIWWSFRTNDSSHIEFMMKEGYKMLDNYGNHASFVMMALGNEIHQKREVLQQMINDFRHYDNRHLYAVGSNNWLGNPSLTEGDDYWTTFRTAKEKSDCSTDVRASASYLDSEEGGILNTFYPSSDKTFSKAIENIPVPVIGHETGQYQVYPNFDEIPKYTGILKPWNLEIFRKRLAEKGMLEQANDFFLASGKLAAICYRDEIELAMRTTGFGGFQLLDLQDYPGQGTALVGLLDAFMDSKGLITPEEFRQFCNDVTILVIMKKYCWNNHETFSAEVEVVNYGQSDLVNKNLEWKLVNSKNEIYHSGSKLMNLIPQGGITEIENISLNLNDFHEAIKVYVEVQIKGTAYKTKYPAWIYPSDVSVEIPDEIMVVKELSENVVDRLEEGGNVLLFPDFKANEKNSVEGMYITDFWNWEMFKNFAEQRNKKVSPGTMGLLMDPEHPIFNDFPTSFHSDRQWWVIVKNSRPVILDNAPAGYKPIVQVIDNIGRNHKLGMVFEFKVGKGKLLVCAVNIDAIINKSEGRQFYSGILNYMKSQQFNPNTEIAAGKIKSMVK